MRRAVFATEQAASAMPDAVARGVGAAGFVGLDDEFQVGAGTADEAAVATGVPAKLVRPKQQRKSRLGDLDRAELEAAGRMPFAPNRP